MWQYLGSEFGEQVHGIELLNHQIAIPHNDLCLRVAFELEFLLVAQDVHHFDVQVVRRHLVLEMRGQIEAGLGFVQKSIISKEGAIMNNQ